MRLIPALDLRGGRVVRLERGDYDRERGYRLTPEAWIESATEAGAAWVHVVDLEGARDGGTPNRGVVERLLGRGPSIQVAGGIRSLETARRWLELGAGRVVVGSAAAEQPEQVERWVEALGAERLVVALDVRRDAAGRRRVATRGWRRDSGHDLEALAGRLGRAGLRHALATAIERDGTLAGPDLELYRSTIGLGGGIAWQASGGVGGAADLATLASVGVSAVVVGRALLEGRIGWTEVARWSRNGSSPVST